MHTLPSQRSLPRPMGAALIALTLAAHPVAAQQGATFTYEVRGTSSAQTQKPNSAIMSATVRAAGPNMRIEWREGTPGPGMKAGGYMLIRGAEKAIYMVSPQDKAAMMIDASAMGTGAGTMTNNALVKVSQRDAKFDFQDLGAGDRILGIPTRHVRVTSSGVTETRIMGRSNTTNESSTADLWIASRVSGIDAEALRQWGLAFGRSLRKANPDLAPRLADYERQFGDGIALRTQMIGTYTDEKGRARVDTMHMEITELSSTRVDPALLEVPKDYQVVDMRVVGQAMGAALDSMKKSGVMDSLNAGNMAKDAAKQSAADAVKSKLGGFLRKKKP